jgi:hypothetical protein
MLGCVALVPHPRQLNRNLTPIEFMVSELSGATPWEFVDAFPCEDICQHHLTGQKKDGFFKKNPCFFFKPVFLGNLLQNQVFIFGPTNSRVLGSLGILLYTFIYKIR